MRDTGMSTKRPFTRITERMPFLADLKQGVAFIVCYYFCLVLLAIVYKAVFFALNFDKETLEIGDLVNVLLYGLRHDFAVAGYFTAIPLLLTLLVTVKRIPLRIFYRCYNGLIAFAVSIGFIADITLYPYWEHKLDAASILIYLDSPSNAAASVSTMHIVILAIILAGLTYAIYKLLSSICKREPSRTEAKRGYTGKVIQSMVYILLAGVMFLGIRGGVSESTNNVGSVYHTSSTFLNHSAVNPIFSFMYTATNMEDFSEEYAFFDDDELQEVTAGLFKHSEEVTDTLLNCTRPNIITIIFEGTGAALIEELGGMQDVTPNINSLSKEGVLFTSCYANSYRTDRGVICTLSGYPSFPKTSVMKTANKSQKLPSLATSLKEAGYCNTFLYGGDINFTNMQGYLFSTGYDRTISDKDFTIEETATHRWGANDDITFNRLYDIVMTEKREPWHITYLTLSSHEPWEVPYDRIKNDKKANAFAFTDEEFGKFIKRLKTSGKWDNTLIICIADHTVMGYPEGTGQTDKERNRILFMLLGGAVKSPGRIDKLCNQTDMVATILAQLQLPLTGFKFSRNILSPEYTVPFAYHSFNNGISFIDSTGFSVIDLNSHREFFSEPETGSEERCRKAKAILQSTYHDFINL